jgi:hypothetical protein
MNRLRRIGARLRRAITLTDALTAAGIAFLAYGAALAWAPAGWAVLGAALLMVARYGTEAS